MPTYSDYRPDRRFQPTVAISPDGARVAYSDNLSGQYNLVVQNVDGLRTSRLTAYADSTVRAVTWTPDGQHLIFSADSNGDEFFQVRLVAATGGEIEALTEDAKVQYVLGEVSRDGRWLGYAGNDREPADQDVLIRDLVTGEERRVYAQGGYVFPSSFAPDGESILALRATSNTETVVYLARCDGDGEAEQLLPLDGEPRVFMPGAWLPDGSGFVLATDAGRDFVGLARFDLGDRRLAWLATPDWDVEQFVVSRDGRVVVYSTNVDGASALHALDLSSGAELATPVLPAGTVQALSLDDAGRRVAVLIATGGRPANVAVADLADNSLRWITNAAAVGAVTAMEPTLVRLPAQDGTRLPAWVYRPAGDGPFPVVLSIHGGPEAQERPAYNYGGLYQYLADRGIGVVGPNIRGSNGYGRAYQRRILRDWGGVDLSDFRACAEYLRSLPWVDPDRMGVFGGSYGGFATLTCLSRLPQYWACGVDVVGPSNLVTLAKSVPPTWRAMMRDWVGDPDTEADFLLERSPITYQEAIRAPLFVIQGANDPRVNKAESDQIVEAVRGRGVEVRYDVYPDEGHGFTRSENEARALGDAAEFLIRHLTR